MNIFGISILESEHIPRGEVWLLPQDILAPLNGEDLEAWADRVLSSANDGRVCIIRGIAR